MECPFCKQHTIILENKVAFAIYDKFPVSPGHMLIIPSRHFANYFEITEEERTAVFDLINQCKEYLDSKYKPDG